MVKSFRDLEVWRLGIELVEIVYKYTARFPRNETYGLAAQMRAAAVSIPSNIAEGQARDSSAEFMHFLSYALGSLAELETQLELAKRLNYLAIDSDPLEANTQVLGKKLHCLHRSIKDRVLKRLTRH